MCMQVRIAPWKGMFILTAKQIEATLNENKVELITYETVSLHSLISNGCLFSPFPILSILFSFLTNEAIITI